MIWYYFYLNTFSQLQKFRVESVNSNKKNYIFFYFLTKKLTITETFNIWPYFFCIRNRCPLLYVTQNKWLHLELSRTAHHLKLILCTGRATHQMTKYTNWEDTKLREEKQQQSHPCEENKKSKDKKCQRKEK